VIRILLVDDHAVLRTALRARMATERDCAVIGEAASTKEAVAMTRSLKPDIVLLDLLLPSKGGCETIPDLLHQSPATRILVMSSQTAPSTVRRALSLGASGYVSKSAGDDELFSAIREVAAGERYVEPKLGASLVLDTSASALEPLSDRERDVMQLIALGYTNQEIAKRLFISARTVDSHRANIMLKVGLESRAELVMCALSTGLIGA
jgi:DNA-binding NarL/FixJ family response regulator